MHWCQLGGGRPPPAAPALRSQAAPPSGSPSSLLAASTGCWGSPSLSAVFPGWVWAAGGETNPVVPSDPHCVCGEGGSSLPHPSSGLVVLMLAERWMLAWRFEAPKRLLVTKGFLQVVAALVSESCSVLGGCTELPVLPLLTVLPCPREAACPPRAGFVCKGI